MVQDTIRYVSIAIDQGSYIPRPVDAIVHDGFGDCKDKSTLLVAILRRLGVEAYPALTDAINGYGLPDLLPSPNDFNHMIVLIRYDGKDYWIDPTMSHQGGRFPNIWHPNYGYALPITEGGENLLKIASTPADSPTIDATEHFIFDQQTAKYVFHVDAIYTENEADFLRQIISTQGQSKFSDDILAFYKKSYPDLEQSRNINIADDRDINKITLSEEYRFSNGSEEYGNFTPYLPSYLRGSFNNLSGTRVYPYALNPNLHVHNVVIVESPGVDAVNIKNRNIDNNNIEFALAVLKQKNKLTMIYDLSVKNGQVSVSDYPDFRASVNNLNNYAFNKINLKKAQETRSRSTSSPGRIVYLILYVVLALLIFFAARYGLRADRDYSQNATYFPVSLKKFIALNIVTSGLYGVFWLWKCWRWIKIRDERDIWPFWRALFAFVWWDALFQNISNRDTAVASPRWVGLASWGAYITLLISSYLPAARHSGMSYGLQFIALFCILPTVAAVNRLNRTDDTALRLNSRINGWNIVGFILGGLVIVALLAQITISFNLQ